MGKTTVALMCFVVLFGVWLQADDKPGDSRVKETVGHAYKGTCRLEGKRWYHFGSMPNGASFDELWERVH
jgi:hypothetical protein